MTMTKKQSKQVRCPHCGHKADHQPTEIVHGAIDNLRAVAGLRCVKCGGNFEETTALRGRDWIDEPLDPKAMSAAGASLAEMSAAIDTLTGSFRAMGECSLELREAVRAVIEHQQRSRWRKFIEWFARDKVLIELKREDERC